MFVALWSRVDAVRTVVSVKLTAPALGLGDGPINAGKTVDNDLPGFITSSVTGEGSILTVLTDGKADHGVSTNPLLVTITAKTYQDVVTNVPDPTDYHAGIIYISEEKDDLPDGRKEGLGVRAFMVHGANGLRMLDLGEDAAGASLLYKKPKPEPTGRAFVEGSKHVSGGTDDDPYDPGDPNGPPHVDECVTFDFNPDLSILGQSIVVLLSDFESADIIDLHVELDNGSSYDLSLIHI